MAWTGDQWIIPGLRAGEDLSAKQFHFVKLSAEDTVVACSAVTDVPIGVLQNKPASGKPAIVCGFGITKVSADEQLAVGNLISTSADGQAALVAPGTDTTVHIVGQVLKGASKAGVIATAAINCFNPARGA